VLDLCYVAAGRLDGCYEQGFSAWDVAAGVLIVEEAGGKVTDHWGGRLDPEGSEGLVASNGPLACVLTTKSFAMCFMSIAKLSRSRSSRAHTESV
jgi:fructose-1,6-bisphosphatase/inositol monophosphatase family enzyme